MQEVSYDDHDCFGQPRPAAAPPHLAGRVLLVSRCNGDSLFRPVPARTRKPAPMFVFLATMPLAWGLLRLAMGRVRGAAVLPTLAVMSLVAMMLDGVAPDVMGMAAAWLLWGVAWTFVWAFYRREQSE